MSESRLVLDPLTNRYAKGFDRDRVYRFSRISGDHGFVGKISECPLDFNVAGLLFAELPASNTARTK